MCARVLRVMNNDNTPEWSKPIQALLEMVERTLESAVESEAHEATELSTHLLRAGGKRIRPALVILSALASNPDTDTTRVIEIASATELFHMASLVHDDVVDKTGQRRGRPTATSIWDNRLSVLGGDFLLARAFSLLAANCDSEIMKSLSGVAVSMTESEILQASSEGSLSAWRDNYWSIINGKTAAFMSACCECGARTSDASPEISNALAEYGRNLGLAFQITDDILDIAGSIEETGKDSCTDLMHGKFTLPIIEAMRMSSGDNLNTLRKLTESGRLTREQALETARIVIECGAIDSTRVTAEDFAQRAFAALDTIIDSAYKDSMLNLGEFVLRRSY